MTTLVFPEAIDSFHSNRSDIRAGLRDTYNRLHSIAEDAAFVNTVHEVFPLLPVVANQRAGAWYVWPEIEEDVRAYFKSTDGHIGVHDFSIRRSNLSLVPLIVQRDGILFVDSTRRGKRFPDALSKTIPIWCAVLNRARMSLSPPTTMEETKNWEENGKLWTLPSAVGRSEHDQIDVKIDEWAKRLVDSSYDLSKVKGLKKPLRPIFISPASTLRDSDPTTFHDFTPVILVSASKLPNDPAMEEVERSRGYSYVQGSGDDHEAWSKGLTPKIFWAHRVKILSASRQDVTRVVSDIVDEALSSNLASTTLSTSSPSTTEIRRTKLRLAFGSSPPPSTTSLSSEEPFRILIWTEYATKSPSEPSPIAPPTPIKISTKPGKPGYTSFFSSISPALEMMGQRLQMGKEVEIWVTETGGDANELGVALALVVLAQHFDSQGALIPLDVDGEARHEPLTKTLIRSRLQWILETFPSVNPSRAILNRVNEFVLSGDMKPNLNAV